MFLWSFEVRELINLYGTVTYYNIATEIQDDKNMAGMVMSLGGIALLLKAFFIALVSITSQSRVEFAVEEI